MTHARTAKKSPGMPFMDVDRPAEKATAVLRDRSMLSLRRSSNHCLEVSSEISKTLTP